MPKHRLKRGDIVMVKDCPWGREDRTVGDAGIVSYRSPIVPNGWVVNIGKLYLCCYKNRELCWLGTDTNPDRRQKCPN
jgi:hypothetical protein